MNIRLTALLAALAASTLLAGPLATAAIAAPPTDEQITAVIDAVKKAGEGAKDFSAKQAAERAAADEGLKTVTLGEATLAQIESMMKANIFGGNDARAALAPRLADLSKAPTKDGAQAALWRVTLAPNIQPKTREEYEAGQAAKAPSVLAALTHAGTAELINTGAGDGFFRAVSALPASAISENKILEAVEPLITTKLSFDSAVALGVIVDKIADAENKMDKAAKVKFLDKIGAAADAALTRTPEPLAKADEGKVKRIKDTATSARSRWARGELLNGPAPEIKFNWTSTNASPKSLADLKGKVVLVDFWATWCGPCIASFPSIRELQARYQGFAVEIISVTSVQGFSMDYSEKPAKRIDCKGDAAKEMALMPDFMKNKDMTWTVAFSEDSCFNPGFGVKGIPHVAIIAPDGTVRWNELRPGDPTHDAEKIDALLKEFKLAAPEKAMEKKGDADDMGNK